MKKAWYVMGGGLLLACATAVSAETARPMTPKHLDAALAGLSREELAWSSPRMRAVLARAFPPGDEALCEGPFEGRDAQNNCQWFGELEGDEPSPWPRFFLFFEDNRLVSVMTHHADALRRSRQWRCAPVRDQRRMGFTECVRTELPAARVAALRSRHLAMVNGAD